MEELVINHNEKSIIKGQHKSKGMKRTLCGVGHDKHDGSGSVKVDGTKIYQQ